MIRIVLSTDSAGYARNATLLASILRRSSVPVAARVYTRGFEVSSFKVGSLSVEFRRCDDEVSGRYPGHVPHAVFDRLRIIRDEEEWDRVLVMDHDMVVLCDLAPYFEEAFDGELLMGRLFAPGNTLGVQMARRGGLPSSLKHCEDYPYFFMGPMMNLAAMRKEGTWERLLEYHEAIGQDEQISLTAATGGRVKGVGKRWNLVPQWDNLEAIAADARLLEEVELGGVPWKDGLPQGVVHWTGPRKPWHRGTKIWRADLWEAERVTWEVLRSGRWEKPRAVEVRPKSAADARGLLERGWKVDVLAADPEGVVAAVPAALDLTVVPCGGAYGAAPLPSDAGLIRFGAGEDPAMWLEACGRLPGKIVVRGPRSVEELTRIRELGYRADHRIDRRQWPAGGPHPDVLHYRRHLPDEPLVSDEDLYLALKESVGEEPVPSGWGNPPVERERELSEDLRSFLSAQASAIPEGGAILVLGSIEAGALLAGLAGGCRVLAIHHDEQRVREALECHHQPGNLSISHAPADGVLPWYDFSGIDRFEIGLLVVCAPAEGSRDLRGGASSLLPWISRGGAVVLDIRGWRGGTSLAEAWGEPFPDDDAGFVAFTVNPELRLPVPGDFPSMVKRAYVIAEDEEIGRIAEAVRQVLPLEPVAIPAITLTADQIRWSEMKGLEAHGNLVNLTGRYVAEAIARKREMIAALEAFVESGEDTALIISGECGWRPGATALIDRALGQLPCDWELLYLHAAKREPHQPWSPHLVKLSGARGSLAIVWRRGAALGLLDGLRGCDCEWDVYIQSLHPKMKAFCVMPLPLRIGRGLM